MPLTQHGPVRHTGEQRYEVHLRFDPEDKARVYELTPDGKIAPEAVVLVWTRRVGEEWRRLSANGRGSRVEGHVKIAGGMGAVGPYKALEIYTRELGNFKPSLEYLPGLRNKIEEIEAELPR